MSKETAVSTDLMVRSPIKAAIRLAKRASAREIENISSERETAVETLNRIDQLQSSLLPVEHGLLPAIRSKKIEAAKRVRQLESLDKLNQYPVFSLEPLSWRNKEGFPRLAVFSLESPDLEFAVVGSYSRVDWRLKRRWRQKVSPKLPQGMMDCYKDVLDKLSAIAKETKKTARLRAQFGMLIPQAIKTEIARVRGEFKEIFIIAEAPRWDLKLTAIPKPKDPLVVGYDGVNYWLIAAFDPTPLENYIKAEFCVKPQ
jgi:hypothetical protein